MISSGQITDISPDIVESGVTDVMWLGFYCCSWAPEPVHRSLRSTWQPRSRRAAWASSRHDWCDVIVRRKHDSTPRLVNASARSWRLATMFRTAMHADFCGITHNRQHHNYVPIVSTESENAASFHNGKPTAYDLYRKKNSTLWHR